MNKKYFLFVGTIIILNISFFSNNCLCQWVHIGEIPEQTVYALAVCEGNIFAGVEYGGVYRSTDNGESWTQTSLNNKTVYSLTTNGSNIFAGTNTSGVYISTNNGTTWTQTSLNNKAIFSLTTNANNIYAGTNSFISVYISTNNGTTWNQTGLNNKTVVSLAIIGNNILAGTEGSGIYLSSNNGTNWLNTASNPKFVYSLAPSESYIFAGTRDSGVYYSADYGISWNKTSLSGKSVNTIIVSGNNIFAGTSIYGVYLSTNNGSSWIIKNQGFENGSPLIKTSLIANSYIFLGTNESVWRRLYSETVGIINISSDIPTKYSLSQNFPNPFNPSTNIRYEITNNIFVILKVYDLLGNEIATLVNESQKAGVYEVQFSNEQISSGIYFYRIQAGNFSETKKMIYLK